ncbi:MAG: hypothetical protein QXL18_02660 [Candidatus Woesearchaeota archaeon]
MKNKKAQTATEFAVLISFILLIFLVFLIVIQTKISQTLKEKNDLYAENMLNTVVTEIRIAEAATDGYQRTFFVPYFLENGMPYNISIIGYNIGGELILTYQNEEKIIFLNNNINSSSIIKKGYNIINKKNGQITIRNV